MLHTFGLKGKLIELSRKSNAFKAFPAPDTLK